MPANNMIIRIWICLLLCLSTGMVFAQSMDDGNPLGQTIQITTRLHSFVGKPTWTLIIRDIDNNQNIPYSFDITKGGNHWVAFTYGRNYLITSSSLQMPTFRSHYHKYKNYKLKNFCNLESNGRIIRGESIYISIEGDLSPDPASFTCTVSRYPDGNFFVYHPNVD